MWAQPSLMKITYIAFPVQYLILNYTGCLVLWFFFQDNNINIIYKASYKVLYNIKQTTTIVL